MKIKRHGLVFPAKTLREAHWLSVRVDDEVHVVSVGFASRSVRIRSHNKPTVTGIEVCSLCSSSSSDVTFGQNGVKIHILLENVYKKVNLIIANQWIYD